MNDDLAVRRMAQWYAQQHAGGASHGTPPQLAVDMEQAYDVPRWPFYILVDTDGIVRATGLRTRHVDAAVDLLMERERARGAFDEG